MENELQHPGCLVLDHCLGKGEQGLDVFKSLKWPARSVTTIVCTAYANVSLAVEYLRSGVETFVEKPVDGSSFAELISDAVQVDRQKTDEYQGYCDLRNCYLKLTTRQKQVLAHVIDGRGNKNVASTMDISLRTVETERSKILRHFEVHSFFKASRMVTELMLVSGMYGEFNEDEFERFTSALDHRIDAPSTLQKTNRSTAKSMRRNPRH